MCKRLLTSLMASLLIVTGVSAQSQQNLTLSSQVTYTADLNDCWAYSSGGDEYALVGLTTGVSIVDVTNPASPNKLFQTTGPNSTWRDIKTWNSHAYVVNESDSGLLIIDLSNLPTSIQTYRWDTLGYTSAHDIYIDENGYGYIMGSNVGSGGAMIIDLSNPKNPQLVGMYDQNYVHDGFVRNDTFWAAEVYQGWFSVIDVSNKSNPQVMATQSTPDNYTHNIWPTDNGNYAFTTDEVDDAYITAYDVSELNNITEVDRYQSSLSANSAPHNTFYKNGFLVNSYYRDGVTIVDANRPQTLVEVGYYDTSPFSGGGFDGCWGVYPYLPSGTIIATDIQEGLFILSPNYVKACYLEGIVTDTSNGNPVSNADVEILAKGKLTSTGFNGGYNMGIADSGNYDVAYSKSGYFTKTKPNVPLRHGVVESLDVQLVPKPPLSYSGVVNTLSDSMPIPNAKVKVANADTFYMTSANDSGEFTISNIYQDTFDQYAGKWGYQTVGRFGQHVTDSTNVDTFYLDSMVYDDYLFDYSWKTSSTASSGRWERGEPYGTYYSGFPIAPEEDVSADFGSQCFVTGNTSGVDYYQDDIDNGITKLTSPGFDLSGEDSATVQYSYWFQTFNGVTSDKLQALMTNRNDTIVLQTISPADADTVWRQTSLTVYDTQLTFNSTMHVFFITSDTADQNIVEAGIDHFRVKEAGPSLPVARFKYNIMDSLRVQFWGLSWYANSQNWDFGDGQTAVADTVTHQYASDGKYQVCLTATNSLGSDKICDSIKLKNPPVAQFNYKAMGGGEMKFMDASLEQPTSWNWYFGDGQTTNGDTVLHQYSSNGKYQVCLTVSNSAGSDQVCDSVQVQGVGIPDRAAKRRLDLRPNPFDEQISIHYELSGQQSSSPMLNIYNLKGQKIYAYSLEVDKGTIQWGANATPGLYFIELENGEYSTTRKIMKH